MITHGQGGGADFTRFVGVGDSLTAGVRDGALFASGQQQSFYMLLAQSMNAQVTLPLISEVGFPALTSPGRMLQNPGTCEFGAITFATGDSPSRLNPMEQATNTAVPDQTIGDALTARWDIDAGDVEATADTAEDFVLGFPYVFSAPPLNAEHSQVEVAVSLQPTFLSFWLGSNDALGAALAATVNDTTLTPADSFNASAHAAADALGRTEARGVLLNVPDVTVIPNLFSVPDLQSLTGLSAAQIRRRLGVDEGSLVPMSALATVEAIVNGTAQGPLAGNQILTAKEITKIRKRIKLYNKTLKMIASAKGWAYVDWNAVLTDYDKNGVTIPGVGRLTTGYLGGLFGLDGVHPSATGQALIASAVIESINVKYTLILPPPDVAGIAAADPQVCMALSARVPSLHELVKRSATSQVVRAASMSQRANSSLVAAR
jgi:lysophospholipase L1-like esterase